MKTLLATTLLLTSTIATAATESNSWFINPNNVMVVYSEESQNKIMWLDVCNITDDGYYTTNLVDAEWQPQLTDLGTIINFKGRIAQEDAWDAWAPLYVMETGSAQLSLKLSKQQLEEFKAYDKTIFESETIRFRFTLANGTAATETYSFNGYKKAYETALSMCASNDSIF